MVITVVVVKGKVAITHLENVVEAVMTVFIKFIIQDVHQEKQKKYMIAPKCYIIMYANIHIFIRLN